MLEYYFDEHGLVSTIRHKVDQNSNKGAEARVTTGLPPALTKAINPNMMADAKASATEQAGLQVKDDDQLSPQSDMTGSDLPSPNEVVFEDEDVVGDLPSRRPSRLKSGLTNGGGGRLQSVTDASALDLPAPVDEDRPTDHTPCEAGSDQPALSRPDSYRNAMLDSPDGKSKRVSPRPNSYHDAVDKIHVTEAGRTRSASESVSVMARSQSDDGDTPEPPREQNQTRATRSQSVSAVEDVVASTDMKKKRKFKFKNMFKPWKWKRKKPAEKIDAVAKAIERRISLRPNREQVIATGIVKETDVHKDAQVIAVGGTVSFTPGAAVPNITLTDPNGKVSSIAQRRDSLKGKLERRPDAGSLRGKNIIRDQTQPTDLFNLKGTLERKLSIRGSQKELVDRNIINLETPAEALERKLSLRGILQKRLSQRKSAKDLKEKGVLKFNEYVDVYDVHAADDYDRSADKPWTRLTNADKIAIKRELNQYKRDEMQVHSESKKNTRFHR